MQPDAAYLSGLDFFHDVVARYPSGAWQRPSPCAGWSALDVLGHVGAAVRFGTGLLTGAATDWDPVDPPGSVVEGDPARWWQQLVRPARAAVEGVDLAEVRDSPMGRRTIGEGLSFPAVDLFVHAWDLGRTAALEVTIPPEGIEFGRRFLGAFPAEQLRSPRVFGAELTSAAQASPSDAYLAWTGRDPAWSPAAAD